MSSGNKIFPEVVNLSFTISLIFFRIFIFIRKLKKNKSVINIIKIEILENSDTKFSGGWPELAISIETYFVNVAPSLQYSTIPANGKILRSMLEMLLDDFNWSRIVLFDKSLNFLGLLNCLTDIYVNLAKVEMKKKCDN